MSMIPNMRERKTLVRVRARKARAPYEHDTEQARTAPYRKYVTILGHWHPGHMPVPSPTGDSRLVCPQCKPLFCCVYGPRTEWERGPAELLLLYCVCTASFRAWSNAITSIDDSCAFQASSLTHNKNANIDSNCAIQAFAWNPCKTQSCHSCRLQSSSWKSMQKVALTTIADDTPEYWRQIKIQDCRLFPISSFKRQECDSQLRRQLHRTSLKFQSHHAKHTLTTHVHFKPQVWKTMPKPDIDD